MRVCARSSTSLLTPQARDEWQSRTDATVAALERAMHSLREYEQVQRKLRDLGVDVGAHDLNVREVRQQWQRRIQQLRENRDKKYA